MTTAATAAVLNSIAESRRRDEEVYVSDRLREPRRENRAGTRVITTFAGGVGHFSGDGGQACRRRSQSSRVAIDKDGNVYIAESSHAYSQSRRREAEPSHIEKSRGPMASLLMLRETTLPKLSTTLYSKSRQHRHHTVKALFLAIDSRHRRDATGNVYIAEPNLHRIRKSTRRAISRRWRVLLVSGFQRQRTAVNCLIEQS